jgi:3-dehydroquinate synthase
MKTVSITLPVHTQEYEIVIGTGLTSNINTFIQSRVFSKVCIVTDENLAAQYGKELYTSIEATTHLITVPSGEAHKKIETVEKIWKELLSYHADRHSLVLNLGGGVIGDMGGFAASTYMRGIPFLQVPTTLLSMVDASVGGKTGVNFGEIKNLVGSFQQPERVFIDTTYLKSLSDREFASGFAEIIKHGLIADPEYFRQITEKKPRDYSAAELEEIIARSCYLKSLIVESDAQEAGPRKKLNFGHTIGHAIESLSHQTEKPLLHGEAIAVGMVAEAYLSQQQGYLEPEDVALIEESFERAGLPTRYKTATTAQIEEKMKHDKKNSQGRLKWTLLKAIGEADYNIEVGEKYIQSALEYIRS